MMQVFFSILVVMMMKTTFISPFYYEGTAMTPNFQDGDYLITTRVFNILKPLDIVVFQKNNYFIFGRIIALPGESLVYNNEKIKLQADEYFIWADGLHNYEKLPSKEYGVIKKSNIIAKYYLKF